MDSTAADKTRPVLMLAWAAALAAWLLLCLAGWGALRHWHGRERLAADDQAHSLVQALASALRTMAGRMARSEVQLEEVLQEIAATSSIDGMALLAMDGKVLADVGVPDGIVLPGVGQGTAYLNADIIVWDTVDVGRCAWVGQGRRGWRWQTDDEAATGNVVQNVRLVLRVPLTSLYARWRRDAVILGAFDAVALAVALGLVMLWRLSRRSDEYSARLQVAAEEKRALEELNLVAAGLAHEIKNPLGVVRGTAQRLADGDTIPLDYASSADLIVQEIDRVTSRINELMSFAQPRAPELTAVSVATVCRELDALLADEFTDAGLHVRVEDHDMYVRADREQFRQVLFNLLHNAIRFAPGTGELLVRLRQQPDHLLTLEVRDRGPGIPVDAQAQVFSPYVTTSADGIGLGLAIVRRIARSHGWNIACRDADGGGALFEVTDIAPSPPPGTTETARTADED